MFTFLGGKFRGEKKKKRKKSFLHLEEEVPMTDASKRLKR